MDLQGHQISYQKAQVSLTKVEFELLRLFLENPGKAYSRDELLNMVWGYDHFPNTRTVDVHVQQLRAKFFDDLIQTIRGIGYRCKK